MNFENEPKPHAPKRRDISLFEGIRTFAASVGTAALLMLSVCGLIGLPLPENAAAHAVSASHITAKTETVRTVQLGGDVFGIKLFFGRRYCCRTFGNLCRRWLKMPCKRSRHSARRLYPFRKRQ